MDIQAFVNRFDPILDEELKKEHGASTDAGESFGTQGTQGIQGTHGIQKPLFNPQNIDDLLSISRGGRSDAHTGDGRSDARSEGKRQMLRVFLQRIPTIQKSNAGFLKEGRKREKGKKGEKRFVQNAMSIGAYIGCVKSW